MIRRVRFYPSSVHNHYCCSYHTITNPDRGLGVTGLNSAGKDNIRIIMAYALSQTSKNPQISALYVDDEPDLLLLARMFLERSGEIRVTTCESALKALKSSYLHNYDVIISDYQMPGMDGIAFLKSVREKCGDIPFILFTGRGREEVVIEAINNGADFYLQKGGEPKPQFAELAHKIRQAVKRNRAEQSIIESEKKLSDIIDFLPDATFVIDSSGQVIAWNRAIEEMTGLASSDMLGKGDYEYAIPLTGSRRPVLIDLINEPDERIEEFYSIIYRNGTSITAETELYKPNKDLMTSLIRVCPLFNQAGEITGTIESIRDITLIKKTGMELRESEIKFRNLVEYSRDCILILSFDGKILFINPTGLQMIEEDTIEGMKNVMEYVHPESREIVLYDMNQVAQGNDGYLSQYKLFTGKNREIWVESVGRKVPYQQSDAILVSLRDISQRKRYEIALRESEEQFRALTEQSPDIIVRVDKDLRILYCNPIIVEYTGISPEQMIGADPFEFSGYEDTTESWIRTVKTVFETGLSQREECRIDPGFWFDFLYYPEFGVHGEVRAVTTSIRDLTSRKRIEEEREIYFRDLLIQREFSGALLDALPLPVHWKDTNRRYLGCNKALTTFLGIPKEEIIGKTVEGVWPNQDEINDINRHDQELLSRGSLDPYQTKLTDRQGRSHEVIISRNIFRDHAGNVGGIVGVLQDITEYKQLIRDLKHREELFRMIITQSSDIFIIITPHLEVSYISPGVENRSGFLAEEILGPVDRFLHPDDLQRIKGQLERLIHNPSSSEEAEFRSLKRDGSYILLEGMAINCIDNPAIQGILITARDITMK